jgi:hypothetical protein
MRRPFALTFVTASIACAWLAMTALQEFGHAMNAWCSGGRVTSIELPPCGLGHTQVAPNPHPLFVTWGGACWGSLLGSLPLLFPVRSEVLRWFARFFAGVCLIAKGTYLGIGCFFGHANGADDAHELLRCGASSWQLVLFGVLATASGVYIWHRLGHRLGFVRVIQLADWKTIAVFFAFAGGLLCLGIGICSNVD